MSDADQFPGSWRLVTAQFRYDDGSVADSPYGNDPQGLLMYDRDGNMSAQLGQANRPPFAVADRKAGTHQELKAAFESYQAYCGRYLVDDKKRIVTHTVFMSLLPNWTGGNQQRHYEFTDDNLILRTPPMNIGGKPMHGELVWERAP